jgi:uncharacterized membrane protein
MAGIVLEQCVRPLKQGLLRSIRPRSHKFGAKRQNAAPRHEEIHMAPTGWLGLTSLGTVHTAISLVAVVAGLWALWRYREITMRTRLGQVFVWTTVLTCLTGFGIFQHGGFGKAHVLGIITLVALAVGATAGRGMLFGRAARYVEAAAYSASFLFHWIPAFTETLTRLPQGAPLLSSPEAPELKAVTGVLFLLYLVGVGLQVRRLRGGAGALLSPAPVRAGS